MSLPPNMGKIVGFKQLKQGESILKMNDGNYLKVVLVVNKIYKNDEVKTPDGYSQYAVQTGCIISVWKPSEVLELDLDKEVLEK